MDNQNNNSKPTWLNRVETILLGITIIVSVVVSLLDFLGVLDSIPWLAERVPILILLLVGSIAAYLILERRNQLETMQTDFNDRLKDLQSEISKSETSIVQSLNGFAYKEFEKADDVMSYVNERISEADKVDDLSWRLPHIKGYELYSQELNEKYFEQIVRRTKKITYREVFIFSEPSRPHNRLYNRFQRITRILENAKEMDGYSCSYYEETKVPVLQFMVIDRAEVIIFSQPLMPIISVKHPAIVQLFCEYYDEIWDSAIPIKNRTYIYEEALEKLGINLPQDS